MFVISYSAQVVTNHQAARLARHATTLSVLTVGHITLSYLYTVKISLSIPRS